MAGQPAAGGGVRQLGQLGVAVIVLWRKGDQRRAGKALSVRPSGRVPADRRVVVTAAIRANHESTCPPRDEGDTRDRDPG
jgi:hypothetical protein